MGRRQDWVVSRAQALEAGLSRHAIAVGVRSAPEAELRDLIFKAGLPMPLFNPRLYLPNGKFVACPDAWWPEAGVAIEIDSRQWHFAPGDWERTMNRHSDLAKYGIVTLHVTPLQLRNDPRSVLQKSGKCLRIRQGATPPRHPDPAGRRQMVGGPRWMEG